MLRATGTIQTPTIADGGIFLSAKNFIKPSLKGLSQRLPLGAGAPTPSL